MLRAGALRLRLKESGSMLIPRPEKSKAAFAQTGTGLFLSAKIGVLFSNSAVSSARRSAEAIA
jgi:hypothetical protein